MILPDSDRKRNSPLYILQKRYTSGQITKDEDQGNDSSYCNGIQIILDGGVIA